ncbi:MAG: ATP-binding protein [bacterium]|nr:ATP-binding protein [bacterium]
MVSFYRTGFWALLLLVLILGIQYVRGWYGLGLTRISKERELEQHLADLGNLAQPLLRQAALDLTDLEVDTTWQNAESSGDWLGSRPDADLYRKGLRDEDVQPLVEFARRARLTKVVLLDAGGRVLYDTGDPERLLRPFDFAAIDRAEIASALNGQSRALPSYETAQSPFKRFYVPIWESPGWIHPAPAASPAADAGGDTNGYPADRVVAVLCLVAGRGYLDQIALLEKQMNRVNGILTVLMLLVALIIYRLMRRQRSMELQAVEADRLASLGALAAGFAHELRNPLEIIRAFTEDLERTLSGGGQTAEALEACQEIVEEVDRMNRLVGRFLSYSRGAENGSAAGRARVLDALHSVTTILRPSADKRAVALATELAGNPRGEEAARWTAALDAGALKQVLMNLALNAIQASPEGGRVTLTAEARPRELELRVRDEGPGIPARDAARIYEPFFTTRPGGSGLGLAVSRQIALRAGGSLTHESPRSGGGTCFVLRLPRAADAPDGPAAFRGAALPAAAAGAGVERGRAQTDRTPATSKD